MITFLQGGIWAVFKWSECMLIPMREIVMSEVGSSKGERSGHNSVLTDLEEQLFRNP